MITICYYGRQTILLWIADVIILNYIQRDKKLVRPLGGYNIAVFGL
jgi:hypothetical protein